MDSASRPEFELRSCKEVRTRLRISQGQLTRLRAADPSFPAALRLGFGPNGRIAFIAHEIEEWILTRPRTRRGGEGLLPEAPAVRDGTPADVVGPASKPVEAAEPAAGERMRVDVVVGVSGAGDTA
jgi:predicted DNA-binding transcriptional regulator AlpA